MRKSAAFAAAVALASGCSDTCQNTIISTASAPTGNLNAVLFQRDCGATTGFSSQVSVMNTVKAPSGPGNVFVADTDHGAASPTSSGAPWVELAWLSPQHLLIRYDEKARVFTRKDTISGVSITYEKVRR